MNIFRYAGMTFGILGMILLIPTAAFGSNTIALLMGCCFGLMVICGAIWTLTAPSPHKHA
jgi:hypothetical protein